MAFLDQHSNGNFFQSPAFLSLFEGCRNYIPLVFMTETPAGEITGLLTAVIISDRIYGIPFRRILVQGGPVISTSQPQRAPILRALLDARADKKGLVLRRRK